MPTSIVTRARTHAQTALCIVACLSALGAAGEPTERQRDLELIRQQIAALEARLQGVEEETAGLEREMERTAVEIRILEQRLAAARLERAAAERQLRRSEESVAAVRARLDRARAGLGSRLASIYRRDERFVLRSLLAAGADHDALADLRLLRLAAYRDAVWVRGYLAAQRQLARELDHLTKRQGLVEETTAREAARLGGLERLRESQRRALAILERRQLGMSEQASSLLLKEEKVAMLVEILSGRSEESPIELAIADFRGALDWPARGPIVRGFGPRLDERYRTRIPHNGIEIETLAGGEVRVVFPGVVVFSAPFEDFGLTVVVHHPERVFSLYAGLETATVQKGDVVSFAELLGRTRGSLYFEIRSENRPQDPASWLR